MIRIARKIESYSATHNGVKPLNPLQRANTRDPSIETPPLKGGKGSYLYIGVREDTTQPSPVFEFLCLP
jgi:hypothetical protein